jgi:hypothetical protein
VEVQATTMVEKRFHNHNNNQTNPKKQPSTKNKPTSNSPKIYTHQKTHNNNQQKTKVSNPKTGCSIFCKFNRLFFYWIEQLKQLFFS